MNTLEREQPEVIVFANFDTSWLIGPGTPPEFLTFVQALLTHEYTLAGGYVREGAAGHWQAPLAEDQIASASLIIYKRSKNR
jgi:hypothetical protein